MISTLRAGRFGTRNGFVLLATLWLIVAVSAVSLALAVAARGALDGSRNRVNERIAYWSAVGCLARANAALTDELTSQPRTTLSRMSAALQPIGGCRLYMTPSRVTLDVNDLSSIQSRALAIAAGLTGPQVDSAVTAIGGAQLRRFTSDSAIGLRAHTFLRRSRLLRYLSVDSGSSDAARAPREVQAAMMLAPASPTRVSISTAPRPPPPDSVAPSEWWLVASSQAGDPSVTVVVRAKIVSFGGSYGVKEYWVE